MKNLKIWKSGLLTVILAVGTVQAAMMTSPIQERQINELRDTVAQLLAVAARESLISHDDIYLMNYVKTLAASKPCAYVWVQNAEGRFVMHSEAAQIGQPARDPLSIASAHSNKILHQIVELNNGSQVQHISVPVMMGEQRLATVGIGFRR